MLEYHISLDETQVLFSLETITVSSGKYFFLFIFVLNNILQYKDQINILSILCMTYVTYNAHSDKEMNFSS